MLQRPPQFLLCGGKPALPFPRLGAHRQHGNSARSGDDIPPNLGRNKGRIGLSRELANAAIENREADHTQMHVPTPGGGLGPRIQSLHPADAHKLVKP